MKDKIICIVCPLGCQMRVFNHQGKISVKGNKCKRGEHFVINELTNPMRSICTTVKTVFDDVPVLPVRLSADIPKGRIFDVMAEVNKTLVKKRIARGDVIIKNVLGLSVDVIATSNTLQENNSAP